MEFTEWDTRLSAYAVVVDEHRRLLLSWYNGRQPHPLWTLPGGGVEYDESFEAAVVREVREETGYDVAVGVPLATSTWTTSEGPSPPRPYMSARVIFTATVIGGRLGTIEVGGTTDHAKWVPLSQVAATTPRADIIDIALTAMRSAT